MPIGQGLKGDRKLSKMICRVILALLLFLPSINLKPTKVEAEDLKSEICDVKMVGEKDGGVLLELDCKSNAGKIKKFHEARKAQQKTTLAIGLTAISFNRKVKVYYKDTLGVTGQNAAKSALEIEGLLVLP